MLSENVEEIGDYAFQGCQNLNELRIGNSDATLGKGILDDIRGTIDFVEIHKDAAELFTYFRNNYSTKATYIEDLSLADKYKECFDYEVILGSQYGDYIKITGLKSHVGCSSINHKDVVIPSRIGGLPVLEIEERAFAGNKTMQSITIDNVQDYQSGYGIFIGNGAFQGCTSLSIANLGKVQQLSPYAFRKCSSLATVVMHLMCNAVIGEVTFDENGEMYELYTVFEACTNLNNVVIDNSYNSGKVQYTSENGAIYSGEGVLLLCYNI